MLPFRPHQPCDRALSFLVDLRRSRGRIRVPRAWPRARPMFALLALPVASALEPSHATGRVLHEVITVVEIQAAPERVWPHVVAFRPITAWEPARRLAFDVVRSPSPLRELSPYARVSPPHLDGYLRSRRGEFRLVPVSDGRTRLEGHTWYELEMAPEGYWQLLSDYLIHRIHDRVLNHIKREVE